MSCIISCCRGCVKRGRACCKRVANFCCCVGEGVSCCSTITGTCLLKLLCCFIGSVPCGLCCGGCRGEAKSSVLTRLHYLCFLVAIVIVSAILLSPGVQRSMQEDAVRPSIEQGTERVYIMTSFVESLMCQLQPVSEGAV